ncbi:site-specific DNA-methyltransferase [Burkholderia anthina]|uniref:site-specific DNA-methyltransferase n=1 Tax=Burkholderia anthina TaxID=179879 RepID=UPI00158DD24A|nr:site-specific DNA-methyltransferase [Burkholderia anthina]
MSTEVKMPTEIRMRPIGELLPYARNARTHSDDQVAQIAASMKEFGWTNPVLIADDTILAGHGRVMAASKLGLAIVPTLDLSHLSATQRKAYILADNKLALNAGWDLDMLRVEIEDLKAEGFDVALTGFADAEVADLLTPEELDPSDKDPDALPEMPAEPHSGEGDVWILGPHRLMCGDSTSVDAWDTLMAGERADVVWTDPPYNVAYESKLAGSIKNDDMGDAKFHQFLQDAYTALFTVMKPGASIYVAHADTEGYNFRSAFLKAGFKLSGCLIWRKDSLVLGRSDYQWQHEPILYGWKPGAGHRWFGGRKQTTLADYGAASPFERQPDGRWVVRVGERTLVISGDAKVEELESSVVFCEKPARSALHPTTKPTGLITRFLRNSARHNDIVVDAFGGSGSTLIAAEQMGMCARLMELDPRFVDVICARYHAFTGRLPVHAATGEPFPLAVSESLNAK